jgi:photosystem II stability/assembly factor-like uncharacterized protein
LYDSPATENPAGYPTPKGKSYQGIGLENTSCWWILWGDANNVWASFTDIRGIKSATAGDTWSFDVPFPAWNSSYQGAVDSRGDFYIATSSIHDLYQSTHLTDGAISGGVGGVMTSADKGKTWSILGGSMNYSTVGVALDPTNPKRLYATVADPTNGGVYVCQDITKGANAVWTACAKPPRTENHAFNVVVLKDGTVVCTYSGRINASNLFTESSGIFVSGDGGKTWSDRSAPNMKFYTMDITVDPNDASQNTWYASVYNSFYGVNVDNLGGLYRSTDRGVTWQPLMSDVSVGSCTVDPRNANVLYVATESKGLWYSSNAKSANPTFVQTAYPFSEPTRIFFDPFKPGEIWVTSFGNGIRVGQQTGP